MLVGRSARSVRLASALVATVALVLSGLVITSPTAAAADCTPLTDADTASGAPYLTGSVADGADACYTIDDPAGMRLYLGSMTEHVEISVYSAPTVDSPEGSRFCYVEYRRTCRMPQAGPVTVRVQTFSSAAIEFEAQLLRLASDNGCPAQSTAAFGESGDAVASATLGPNEAACWSYDLTAGLHAVNQDDVAWALYDAQGEPVCQGGSRCSIPQNGSYVLVAMGTEWQWNDVPVAKALTLVDLTSTQGCDTTVDLSWTGNVVRVDDASPLELHCRTVPAEAGDRIGHAATRLQGSSGGAASSIVDADGNTVCEAVTGVLGCELTGAPPYRLLVRKTSSSGGLQASVRSFEPGSGCSVVDPDPFGASPADDPLPASGCGQLVVDSEGPTPFIVRPGAAYDAEGNIACNSTRMANCTLTSGRYWVVTSYFPSNEGSTVHDLRSTEGCAEGDIGLSQHEVELSEGMYDCTHLALPEGSVVAAAHSDDTADGDHGIMFVDGDGARLCEEDRNFTLVTCELTGPAPYRAVVGGGPATHEKLGFLDLSRTDSCGTYPGGRLSPDTRAEVALTSGRAISCLSVPAGEADTAEMFRFQRTQGVGKASLHVVKADGGTCSKFGERGFKYCEEGPAGTGYTAVVVQQVDDGDNTYRLSRYGTSSEADGCRPVDSTVLGAPATKGGGLQDFLDATCLRVTADPADRIWVDARDEGGKADMFVFAADGGYKCKTIYNPCVVTGATSYQLLLQTEAAPVDDVDVDAWTLETAEGLTPECVRYQDYDTGFGPLEATLGDDRTGACVALEAAGPLDGYELDIENTEGGSAKPRAMLVEDDATGSVLPCDGWLPDGLQCHSLAYWREETTPLVVFPLSEGVDRLPFRLSGTCIDTRDQPTSGCARIFKVFDATPLTARSGTTATVTVEGRKLRDTEARLVREGRDPVEAVATTVDDRTPSFEFDLAGVEPGAWSLELVHPTDGTLTAPGDFVVDKGLLTSVEAPEVRGVNRVDRTVRAYEGTWSAEPDSFTYQWHVNGRDIDWATSRSLRLRPWMLNDEVTVTVTAHKDGYVTQTADAAGVQVHRGAAPRIRVRPRVKGIKHVGHWVRATHGTWSKKPRRFTYRWYLNGRRLVHQNHRRLFLRRWMRGDRIQVKVTAHRPGCYKGRAWSYRYRVRR
jgi:hypothetical protein